MHLYTFGVACHFKYSFALKHGFRGMVRSGLPASSSGLFMAPAFTRVRNPCWSDFLLPGRASPPLQKFACLRCEQHASGSLYSGLACLPNTRQAWFGVTPTDLLKTGRAGPFFLRGLTCPLTERAEVWSHLGLPEKNSNLYSSEPAHSCRGSQ